MHNLWNKHDLSTSVEYTVYTAARALEVHSPGDSREVQGAPLGQLAEMAPTGLWNLILST